MIDLGWDSAVCLFGFRLHQYESPLPSSFDLDITFRQVRLGRILPSRLAANSVPDAIAKRRSDVRARKLAFVVLADVNLKPSPLK